VFLTALGRGSGVARVMELEWRSLGLLQVERQAPRVTSTGKILHLHADTAPPRRASDGAVVGGRA
jgi:hypothetical protein